MTSNGRLRERYLSREQIVQLEDDLLHDPIAYALTRWLVDSGCRLMEALGNKKRRGLWWEDCHDEGDERFVAAVVTGKMGKQRVVLFRRSTWDVLLALPGPKSGPVFPIERQRYQRILRRLGYHPHMLRHTYATLCHGGGMDEVTLAELLGHASVDTTQEYTHVSEQRMDELRTCIQDAMMQARGGITKERLRRGLRPGELHLR